MKSPVRLDFSKRERALLRRLAEEAWESELREPLTELFEDFGKWASDGMSAFDLSDRIHQFHHGISRELYVRYTTLGPDMLVSRAVALGLLDASALDERLLDKLAPHVEVSRKFRDAR